MTPVDHTKTKQLLIDFSRRSIRTRQCCSYYAACSKTGIFGV